MRLAVFLEVDHVSRKNGRHECPDDETIWLHTLDPAPVELARQLEPPDLEVDRRLVSAVPWGARPELLGTARGP